MPRRAPQANRSPLGARLRPNRARRGAVLAEFIIVLPLMMMTYLSFLQMTYAYTAGLVMRHATTVVARYASVSLESRFIPDTREHAGEDGGGEAAWKYTALQALGPWGRVVTVRSARAEHSGSDPWGDVEVEVQFEYACRVPVGNKVVCPNGVLTRTQTAKLPLNGARYRL